MHFFLYKAVRGGGGRGGNGQILSVVPTPTALVEGGEYFWQLPCASLVHISFYVKLMLQIAWYKGDHWEGVAGFTFARLKHSDSVLLLSRLRNKSFTYLVLWESYEPVFCLCQDLVFSKMKMQLSKTSSFASSPHLAEEGQRTSACGYVRQQLFSEEIGIPKKLPNIGAGLWTNRWENV